MKYIWTSNNNLVIGKRLSADKVKVVYSESAYIKAGTTQHINPPHWENQWGDPDEPIKREIIKRIFNSRNPITYSISI